MVVALVKLYSTHRLITAFSVNYTLHSCLFISDAFASAPTLPLSFFPFPVPLALGAQGMKLSQGKRKKEKKKEKKKKKE
jgi:hypothetical protein